MTPNEVKLRNELLYGIKSNRKAVINIALNHIQSARDYLIDTDIGVVNDLLVIMQRLSNRHDIDFKWEDSK